MAPGRAARHTAHAHAEHLSGEEHHVLWCHYEVDNCRNGYRSSTVVLITPLLSPLEPFCSALPLGLFITVLTHPRSQAR